MQKYEIEISDLPVCTEEVPLAQVYQMLSSSDDRLVVVMDSHAHRFPIGIVTERSICRQILGKQRDPRGLTAANVLDCDVKKIRRADLIAYGPSQFSGTVPVLVIDRDKRLLGLYKGRENWAGSTAVSCEPVVHDARVTHPGPAILGLA